MLLGQVVTTLDGFFKHPSCVHFCVMNLVMIYQTTESRRDKMVSLWTLLKLENERLILVCYHRAVQSFIELLLDVLESQFGSGRLINVLSCLFMFKSH